MHFFMDCYLYNVYNDFTHSDNCVIIRKEALGLTVVVLHFIIMRYFFEGARYAH